MSERCAECDQPLSGHSDKRGVNDLGQLVHLGCMTLTAQERLLRKIFGVGMSPGPRKAAEMAGHQITESRTEDRRYHWQCSCGMGATLIHNATRRADIKRHQAMVIYD